METESFLVVLDWTEAQIYFNQGGWVSNGKNFRPNPEQRHYTCCKMIPDKTTPCRVMSEVNALQVSPRGPCEEWKAGCLKIVKL